MNTHQPAILMDEIENINQKISFIEDHEEILSHFKFKGHNVSEYISQLKSKLDFTSIKGAINMSDIGAMYIWALSKVSF